MKFDPIDVMVKTDGKFVKCKLSFGRKLTFSDKDFLSIIEIDWLTSSFSITEERVPVFSFIKKLKKCFKLSDLNGKHIDIYIDNNSKEFTKLNAFLTAMRTSAIRKNREELSRIEAEKTKREELAPIETEKVRFEILTYVENEKEKQEESDCIKVEESDKCDFINSNITDLNDSCLPFDYLKSRVNEYVRNTLNPYTEILAAHCLEVCELLCNNSEDVLDDTLDSYIDDLYMMFSYHRIPLSLTKKAIVYIEDVYTDRNFDYSELLEQILNILHYCESLYLPITYYSTFGDYGLPAITNTFNNSDYCAEFEDLELNSQDLGSQDDEHIKEEADKIYQYILEQKRPISRRHLRQKFNSYSGKIMDMVLSFGGIIDIKGDFFAVNNMPISSTEYQDMFRIIVDFLSKNNDIAHCIDIYEELLCSYNSLLNSSYISDGKSLFGLLMCVFGNGFSFGYPYIATKGIIIPSSEERLSNYILSNNVLEIDNISEYIRKNHLKVGSLLSFLVSMNSEFLIKNRNEIVMLNNVKITSYETKTIEQMIVDELNNNYDCVAIRDLKCVRNFSVIEFPWDEWLIYSVLSKWGTQLCLHTTSPKFKSAIPIVSLNDFIDDDELEKIANKFIGQVNSVMTSKIDDLEFLDDLIADEIDLSDIDLDDYDNLDFNTEDI